MEKLEYSNKKGLSFKQFMASIWWVLRFNYKILPKITIISFINEMISQFTPVINAYIFAWTIDYMSKSTSSASDFSKTMLLVIFVFVGYALISTFFSDLGYFTDEYARRKNIPSYFQAIFEKLNGLSMEEIETAIVSDKLFRIKNNVFDFTSIVSFILEVIPLLFRLIFLIVIFIPIIPTYIVLLFVIAIPRYISHIQMIRTAHQYEMQVTPARRVADETALATLTSKTLHEIKLQRSYDYFGSKYFNLIKEYLSKYFEIASKRYIVNYIITIANFIVLGFAIMILGNLFFTKTITIGMFSFYLTNAVTLLFSLSSFMSMTTSVYERIIKFQDLRDVVDYQSAVRDGTKELKLIKSPQIELRNVSFSYPSNPEKVIKNVSFTINPGEKIAIVGENGAGKTTLIRLLLRIYQLMEGDIFIDGVPLKDVKVDSWYDNVGVLFQDYNTYPQFTVSENIQVGDIRKKADRASVMRALEQADALEFVQKYPNGLDQILSEHYTGGLRPSTGQWQKIAIARFLFRDPPVVILDEPTASIDALSEARIFGNIFNELKDKTVIIISHRFSTVRNADRILVLKDGAIIEEGSHSDLIKLNGVYASSFNLQAKGYTNSTA